MIEAPSEIDPSKFSEGDGESDLFVGVIAAAVVDAGSKSRNRDGKPTRDTLQAHEFLTAAFGSWAASRKFCGTPSPVLYMTPRAN